MRASLCILTIDFPVFLWYTVVTELRKGAVTMFSEAMQDFSYESAMADASFASAPECEDWPDDLWDDGPEDPWGDEG